MRHGADGLTPRRLPTPSHLPGGAHVALTDALHRRHQAGPTSTGQPPTTFHRPTRPDRPAPITNGPTTTACMAMVDNRGSALYAQTS